MFLVAFSSDIGAITLGVFSGIAYLAAIFLYAPLLMAREGGGNGQTWGKQIVGISAVRDVGQPFDFGNAFLREFVIKGLLFGTVGGWFFGIPTLLDYLWPLWDDENRCLHDMVAKTHVVRG
nr:RDD family [uncultured bacterium]